MFRIKQKINILIFALICIYVICASGEAITFGAIADPQWSNRDPELKGVGDNRYYRESKEKLKKCLNHLSAENLDFIITVGDMVDVQWDAVDDHENNLNEIFNVYNDIQLKPNVEFHDFIYFVIGNHEYSLGAKSVEFNPITKFNINLLNNSGDKNVGYYAFSKKGFKLIVLDGVEESRIVPFKMSNCQMRWLEEELFFAYKNNTPVIIFSHFPSVDNIHTPIPHGNATEILNLIKKYPIVRAYINGHLHQGLAPVRSEGGTWHISLNGMVHGDNVAINNTYYKIQVTDKSIVLRGYGDGQNDNATLFKDVILLNSTSHLLLE